MTKQNRLSVNLPQSEAQTLKELAASKGTTVTAILQEAIVRDTALVRARLAGAEVLLQTPDGNTRGLVWADEISLSRSKER